MSFSDELEISGVEKREPLDKQEWIRRVAKVLLCNNNKHKASSKTKTGKPRHE